MLHKEKQEFDLGNIRFLTFRRYFYACLSSKSATATVIVATIVRTYSLSSFLCSLSVTTRSNSTPEPSKASGR